jgi:regulator of replication initiation timing
VAIKESMQQHEWLIERQQLLERIKELEAENTELRKRLGEDVTPTEKKPTAMQNLSLQEKVTPQQHLQDSAG